MTKNLKNDKKKWEERKLENSERDPTKLWGTVQSWLNWGNNGPPTKICDDGNIITSPSKLAAFMNSFFVKKIKLLKDKIPHSTRDPCAKLKRVMQDRQCSFKFRPVSPEEVQEIVSSLKNSRAVGIDNIPTKII